MMEKIDHIGVAVKDLDATLRFYEEILGLPVTERMDRGNSRGAFEFRYSNFKTPNPVWVQSWRVRFIGT